MDERENVDVSEYVLVPVPLLCSTAHLSVVLWFPQLLTYPLGLRLAAPQVEVVKRVATVNGPQLKREPRRKEYEGNVGRVVLPSPPLPCLRLTSNAMPPIFPILERGASSRK